VALLFGAGLGYLAWRRAAVPQPPAVDLAGADPALARAVGKARQAVLASPREAAPWGRLGMLLSAHEYGPEARACFAEAERLDPAEPRWPYFHALALEGVDPAAALPYLRRAADRAGAGPDTPRLRLAEALLGQGRLDEAAEQFRQALARDPDNARAHLGLARVAQARGDGEDALAHVNRAAAGPSSRKAALLLRAEVCHALGRPGDADRDRRRAADLPDDPPWPDPYAAELEQLRGGVAPTLARASRLFDAGQRAEALALVQRAVDEHPDSIDAWLTLASAQRQLGDLPAAEEALREVVRLDPGLAKGQFLLGAALFAQHKYGPAAECFRKASELEPQHALAHYNLGQCRLRQGDRAGAAEAFRAAVRYKPEMAAAHRALGELLAQDGRRQEALAHLRNAVDLDPADGDARKLLEEVQTGDGKR
jgi:HemY protein